MKQANRSQVVGTYVPGDMAEWWKAVVTKEGRWFVTTYYFNDGTRDVGKERSGQWIRTDIRDGYFQRVPEHMILPEGLCVTCTYKIRCTTWR